MNENRKRLLQALMKHKHTYLSGESLSEALQISRTAIWKHVEELKKDGYGIEAVRKQGYRLLYEPEALTEATLYANLKSKWVGHELYVYDQVASTQQIAREKARQKTANGSLVIADQQIQGKGRMGREWFSPPGTGIWMSLVIRPKISLDKVQQLTLLSAVAVLRGLQPLIKQDIHIKWPNDLLLKERKLAGILTEVNAEADRIHDIVIGFGINVNQDKDDFPVHLQSTATSLYRERGQRFDRKQCIVSILKEWEALYELYTEHGFPPIKTLWEAHAHTLGREIRAKSDGETVKGIARGITDEGVLLLEEENGQIRKIYSADID